MYLCARDNCIEEILNLFLGNVGMTKIQLDNYIDLGPRHLNYHPQPSIGLKIAKKLLSMKDVENYQCTLFSPFLKESYNKDKLAFDKMKRCFECVLSNNYHSLTFAANGV